MLLHPKLEKGSGTNRTWRLGCSTDLAIIGIFHPTRETITIGFLLCEISTSMFVSISPGYPVG